MREEISNWTELLFQSMRAFGENLMGTLPNIIGAILILFIGWLMAKLISSGIAKLLKVAKFDKLADMMNATEMLKRGNILLTPSKLVGRFIYWLLMLLVFITASETLGWDSVSKEISKLLGYLPALFSAILFFTVGVYFATIVRDFIKGAMKSLGISVGNIISSFAFYLLIILVTLTSLDQAGIDTSIITSNLLIILGAILGAAAISYGFASRDIFSNILASLFSRRMFEAGQTIEFDGVKGKVVGMSNISVTIQSGNEKIIIPTHQLITNKVKIIEE